MEELSSDKKFSMEDLQYITEKMDWYNELIRMMKWSSSVGSYSAFDMQSAAEKVAQDLKDKYGVELSRHKSIY